MAYSREWIAGQLQSADLFSSVDPDALRQLSERCRVRQIPAGEPLAWESDAAGSVFFVAEGRLAVERITDDGLQVHLATIEKGEIAGELSLFLDRPRNADLRALDACVVISIDGRELLSQIEKNARFALAIIQGLARRIHAGTEVKSRSPWKLPRRLAYLLVERALRDGIKTERGYELALGCSQAQLAAELGCTRESLNRAIRDLKDQGILEWNPGRVRIVKPRQLQILSRG